MVDGSYILFMEKKNTPSNKNIHNVTKKDISYNDNASIEHKNDNIIACNKIKPILKKTDNFDCCDLFLNIFSFFNKKKEVSFGLNKKKNDTQITID